MKNALITGSAQGVEFSFSLAAYNDLTTLAPASGCAAYCVGSLIPTPSWFGLAFNFAKFPGDDINFRRAMAFIQDYGYLQATILNGGEGTASPDFYVCPPFPSGPPSPCPAVSPMGVYATSLTTAGMELEQIDGSYTEPDGSTAPSLFCTNAGVACAGTYGASSTWCLGAADGNGNGICDDSNTAFFPKLVGRTTHHRAPWALKMVADLATIGVSVNNVNVGGGTAGTLCFTPNALEVTTPGAYQTSGSLAFYNSNPTFNGANIAADTCDMYTYGFISSVPSLIGLAQTVNSQFAGSSTNTGNFYDDPTFVTAADPACGSCASGAHTTTMNVDYNTNKIIYAPTITAAYTSAQDLANALAMDVPIIPGFYEFTPWVVNVDGWTGFVGVSQVGPTELGGLYWTFLNVHACGSATCTLGAVNGGTLGGSFTYNLQFGPDGGYGFNPTYNANWVWQADVYQMLFDSPLVIAPTQFDSINAYTDFMTTSFTDGIFSGTTGQGGSWFYFQQPCGATISLCNGKAGPEQHPGPLQHGAGLSAAQRTITNGEKIVFNLKSGLYFYDGQQINAKDVLASLDVLNVAGSPNYPDSGSPAYNVLGGPNGLIAGHITPGTKNLGVELYFGKQSVWNLGSAIPVILPTHITKYLNHDHFSDLVACAGTAADISMPWNGASASCAGLTSGTFALSSTSYIRYLPNLAVPSGPFYLNCVGVTHDPAAECWDTTNGAGVLNANPYYFNTNWQAQAAVNVASGSAYTFSMPHVLQIYNPTATAITCGPSTPAPIAPGTWGNCQLMNPWAATGLGTVKVYDSSGNLVRNLKLIKDTTTGLYTVNVPVSQAKLNGGAACATFVIGDCFPLSSGNYEIVLQTKYTLKPWHTTASGGAGHWFQIFGFSVP